MSVIQRIGAIINDAVTSLFSTWSSTKIAAEIASAGGGADYVSDYYVSDDIGDDTNTGLSIANAFKTLEKALDTGEAAAVPYAIHILDDSEYTPQAASGTRSDTIEFVIDCPTGTIIGPAGGLIWEVPRSQIFAAQMNGQLLTFSPSSTVVRIQHNFGRVINPNTLYKSVGVSQDAFIIQAIVNETMSDAGQDWGTFCDLTERGKLEFTGNFITSRFVTTGLSVFKVAGANSSIYIKANNVDIQGGVPRYIVDISDQAIGYITAHCSSNNPFAIVDGAGTKLFAMNVDGPQTPETFTVTNGGRVYDSSPVDGFNFDALDATSGLSLVDQINVRDDSEGRQKKATLTEVKSLFQGSLFSAIVSPPALTGDVDNYNPAGIAPGVLLIIDPGGSDRDITGFNSTGFVAGDMLYISEASGSDKLKLKDNDGASSAGNRFAMSGDLDIKENMGTTLYYNGTFFKTISEFKD